MNIKQICIAYFHIKMIGTQELELSLLKTSKLFENNYHLKYGVSLKLTYKSLMSYIKQMCDISMFSTDLLFLSANLTFKLQVTDSCGEVGLGIHMFRCDLYKTVYLSKGNR